METFSSELLFKPFSITSPRNKTTYFCTSKISFIQSVHPSETFHIYEWKKLCQTSWYVDNLFTTHLPFSAVICFLNNISKYIYESHSDSNHSTKRYQRTTTKLSLKQVIKVLYIYCCLHLKSILTFEHYNV